MLYKQTINTPIGEMIAISNDSMLLLLDFFESCNIDQKLKRVCNAKMVNDCSNVIIDFLKHEIVNYFNGNIKTFETHINLVGTKFQERVWLELLKIPYGETISYKDLASRVFDKNASRAVGNANSKNNFAIIIPCHRVVKSFSKNKNIGGYSSGSLKKQYLIDIERKFKQNSFD